MNYNNVAELNGYVLEELYYMYGEYKMFAELNDGYVINLKKEDE